MKVLYLFAGSRKKFKGDIHVDFPDTQFYGFNHLKELGIKAQYKELPRWFSRLVGFNLKHIFSFFYTFGYDVVFGSSLLNTVLLKKLFRTKTKFVLLNISLSRLIRSNEQKPFKMRIIRWLLQDIDAVVCLSESQKQDLAKTGLVSEDRIFFVHLGVDDIFYYPNFDDRDKMLLAVGRDNGRDYATIVDVARLMPERTFEIVCSHRNIKHIDSIPDNVVIRFDMPVAQLRQRYLDARALLLITHEESHCDGADCSGQTVLLDAMASGLPVIATCKGWLKDYGLSGNDVCVNPYDSEGLKKAIVQFDDEEYRMELAKKSRKLIEGELSTLHMAEELKKVFEKVYEEK